MKRRSFIQSLGVGSIFAGVSASRLGAAQLKRPSPANTKVKPQVCTIDRRVFKTGEEAAIVINSTPDFIKTLRQIDIKDDDGEYKLKPSKRAKYAIDGDKITIKWTFQTEGMHIIYLFCGDQKIKSKRKGKSLPTAEYLPVYALDADLYALRAYKGDLHMHTTFSDGANKPEVMGARCLELGFDFQAASDHKTQKGSMVLVEKFNPLPISMRCFPGEECHKAVPHIHSIGASAGITEYIDANKDAFEKRVAEIMPTLPQGLTPAEARAVAASEAEFEIIKKLGGMAGFNHPFWRMRERSVHLTKRVVEVLCKRANFDYLELVNAECSDDSTDLAIAALLEARGEGKDLRIAGNSDAHKQEALGKGYNIVFAKSNGLQDVRDAIMGGKNAVVEAFDPLLPRIFGKIRHMQFAYFLYQFFFPLHDAICKEQAKLLKDCIKANYSEESKAALSKKAEEVKALYKIFWGA